MSDASQHSDVVLAYRVPPRRPRARRILQHVIGLTGLAAILLISSLLEAEGQQVTTQSGYQLPALCVLRGWTGLPCPGCGLTRCFVHMSHGDIASAWSVSPAGILFFALVVAQIPVQSVQLARAIQRRPDPPIARWSGPALALVAALLILQWLLRLCVS